jgi:hypothetical protein
MVAEPGTEMLFGVGSSSLYMKEVGDVGVAPQETPLPVSETEVEVEGKDGEAKAEEAFAICDMLARRYAELRKRRGWKPLRELAFAY